MPLSARARAGWVLVATLLGVVLTANLGAWQLRRAAQKTAMQEERDQRGRMPSVGTAELARTPTEAQAQLGRPVRLRGRWLPERQVFLENRQLPGGRVGFYLVTPLRLEGREDAVLVQRGWVPRDQRDRSALPSIATASGPVDVEGHIAPPPARLYEFAPSTGGLIRQNIELGAFSAETGLRLVPMSVQQADSPATAGDGLVRDWPRPAIDVQRNYGYAFQWFAMCALMSGLYVWFQLIRPWRQRHVRP